MKIGKSDYTTVVASPCNRDHVVLEIYRQGMFVAQLSDEAGNGKINIEFAAPGCPPGTCVEKLDLDEFLEIIKVARERLE